MSKQFGFSLLAAQVADHLASEFEWMERDKSFSVGQTAIESLLFQAVSLRCKLGASEWDEVRIATTTEQLTYLRNEPTYGLRLVVYPQYPVKNRRVDFLFTSRDYTNAPGSDEVWRELLVECDGHDFHERTKEQAAKDRAKDREAIMDGFEFFRFTGSEIWRDPWGCAEQILAWASRGL